MIVTIGGIPVYDALITDEETGMFKISLVDDPAVMSNFMAFDREKRPMMYAIQNEEKRLVRGVVMRADFPIYRRDDNLGEYYVIYKADQIRKMAEKYLLEGRQNDVNTMHQDGSDVEGVQMVQYFIKGDGVSVDGFDDIADGSLFAEFHVTNDDVWASIKDGSYKGFSLEGVFELTPEQDLDKTQEIVDVLDGAFKRIFKHSTNKTMSKLSRLKAALAKALQEFGNVTTDKGVLAWDGDDDLKTGDPVYIEDTEGNRTPAEDGDYKTEDNKVIVVADGKVSEIVEDSADPAVEETEMKAKKVSRFSKIRQAFEDSYEEKERKLIDAITATLAEGEFAFLVEAGDNYAVVNIYSEDNLEGKYIKYAVAWSESGVPTVSDPEEVKFAFVPVTDPNPADPAPSAEEMAALKKENKELKAQVEKMSKNPLAKPAHQEVVTSMQFQKTGVKGLDNLARILSAK